jgi:hypothetical protein
MRYQSIALFALLLVASTSYVEAQTYPYNTGACNTGSCNAGCRCSGYGLGCDAGYHENNLWPAQYIPTARCSVNSAYTAMINNGWRRQNLLGDYHFEEGSNELTTAGKLKSKWILTQAPQDRRNIYIERGQTQSETASRIAAVHSWANNHSPTLAPMLVNDTHIVAEGHTAGSVDSIFVGFHENQPAPVLTPDTGSSSGDE